eukprot:SAG31_NODE_39516_length_287_cov_1.361702_1_plen_24_part_01
MGTAVGDVESPVQPEPGKDVGLDR